MQENNKIILSFFIIINTLRVSIIEKNVLIRMTNE